MTEFEKEYFQKAAVSPPMVRQYVENACRDLKIAQQDPFTEVQFTYAYQSLIKSGIALLAAKGKVKVRSVPGHHVKILAHLSRLLADENIFVMGNAMRMKRNQDMYGAGGHITKKEAAEYVDFVAQVAERVKKAVG